MRPRHAGYESVWLPEHLVFPTTMSRSPKPGEEHPPVPPTTPVFDAFTYLAFLAAPLPDAPARAPTSTTSACGTRSSPRAARRRSTS